MSSIKSLMRMLMLLSIIFCSNLFTSLLITSKCLRLVIRVKGSCPISPLWPPTLQMGFTHMETADQRTPEHKRLLIKTTCGSPVMLWCLGVNAIAKAPVNLALFHWHTYTHGLHGLTPTLQVASITALLKPAATAAACTALKPTIGLRNSWFSLFFLV